MAENNDTYGQIASFFGKLKAKQEDDMEVKMETKSRYEILKELNDKKQNYIIEKSRIDDVIKAKERKLKQMSRDLEDLKEEIAEMKSKVKEQEKTYDILIAEVEKSIEGLTHMKESQSQKTKN
jgi:uncharacterized protein HemX